MEATVESSAERWKVYELKSAQVKESKLDGGSFLTMSLNIKNGEAKTLAHQPVTEEQAKLARAVYGDFGRGSGHPARLNFGDCFAYALATGTGEPLIYKGDNLAHAGLAPI
jgi:uncharacterized protein with PIN domain